jgi:hypothetical protein
MQVDIKEIINSSGQPLDVFNIHITAVGFYPTQTFFLLY